MEEQEEKEGTDWGELFGHAVRFMILVWSLAMMTLGYMDKIRNDGAFLAGLTSGVLGSYGIRVNKRKPNNAAKIVDSSDPTELFAESAGKWASLAFAPSIKK